MRRLTTYTPAPPFTSVIAGRLERLRLLLRTANGEWADRIENDIAVLERMLAK